jgi:site-specific recombinase XerC
MATVKSRNDRWKPSSVFAVDGVEKTLNEWAAGLGCPVQTILGRLQRGWKPAAAVSAPMSKQGGASRGTTLPAETLTKEECQRILDHCNDGATGVRNRAMIVIGWRAGLREAEVISLDPQNITVEGQSIRVMRGKGDKSRTVGIDATALEYLGAWTRLRETLPVTASTPLFCTLAGGRVSGRYVRALMSRLGRKAKIAKRVHFHGLRHTHAAELADENVPMNVIQQQLGHSNLAITSRYLAHLNPAETVSRMKDRVWNRPAVPAAANGGHSPISPPDFVSQLRAWIGDRLLLFNDARLNADNFRAIVLLVD